MIPMTNELKIALGASPDTQAIVIYDGECVFCASYVLMLRLREAVGKVEILDARQEDRALTIKKLMDLDVNQGMLMIYGEKIYHGPEAMHVISMLSSSSGFMNRLFAAVFKHPNLSKAMYPLLRFGRNITLALRGRKQMKLTQ